MTQGFVPGYPGNNVLASSAPLRDSLEALSTNQRGASIPAYAVEGMSWYNDTTKRLTCIKPRGSKAFGQYNMGATLRLAIALRGAGQDGSLINADVRVQDGTLLVPDRFWDITGGALKVYFSSSKTPSYFAARFWADTFIDEPILWTADGDLRNKNFESIPFSFNENIYTPGISPLSNVAPFASTTLRAIDLEIDALQVRLPFTVVAGVDHVVLPLSIDWSDAQDAGGEITLWEGGSRREGATFKYRPFRWGGSIFAIVYNIDPVTQTLIAFDNTKSFELIVRKPT
jgi:hypothetical protein